jgi:hypothetical protein
MEGGVGEGVVAVRSARVVTWGRLATRAAIDNGKQRMKWRDQVEEAGVLLQALQEGCKEEMEVSEVDVEGMAACGSRSKEGKSRY